ncbi:MAG: hypothetical protein WBQ94_14435, partial [Terracidiphilus sp.]
MYFKFEFIYTCQNCAATLQRFGSGEKGDNPPILKCGPRTLHCECDKDDAWISPNPNNPSLTIRGYNKGCYGIMRYTRTQILLVRESELLNKAANQCLLSKVGDSKTEIQGVIDKFSKDLKSKGQLEESMQLPDDFWKSVQLAYKGRKEQLTAQTPKTAWDAVLLAIQSKAYVEDRTLCVAFNKSNKKFKTGNSGGKHTKIWKRIDGQVECTNPDVRLKPLADKLSGIEKKLEREVWVCAETEATVKALLEGWKLEDLSWAAMELQKGK